MPRKQPCVGFRVVRIDPLRFLAECHTRICVSCLRMLYIVVLFIRAPLDVVLVFVDMCSVFWLLWLSCQ